MLAQYAGLVAMAVAGAAVCGVVHLLARWLGGGPVRGDAAEDPDPAAAPGAASRVRPSPSLLPVAILYLVFQVGILTVLLWGAAFRELGSTVWGAMGCFVGALACGWFYVWSRGGFE